MPPPTLPGLAPVAAAAGAAAAAAAAATPPNAIAPPATAAANPPAKGGCAAAAVLVATVLHVAAVTATELATSESLAISIARFALTDGSSADGLVSSCCGC
ncbi:hypothetical protein Vafri_2715 [Volvox africanus]|uniref:Uncharacterized protein n=1 Tax=Volvox africanus TaxID=51714 RepID=A0A8J4ARP9_9CHLO|nr:hypothetical protein Vafri_2715 [Volvox africanus]